MRRSDPTHSPAVSGRPSALQPGSACASGLACHRADRSDQGLAGGTRRQRPGTARARAVAALGACADHAFPTGSAARCAGAVRRKDQPWRRPLGSGGVMVYGLVSLHYKPGPHAHPGLHVIAMIEAIKGLVSRCLAASGLELLGPAPLQHWARRADHALPARPATWRPGAVRPPGLAARRAALGGDRRADVRRRCICSKPGACGAQRPGHRGSAASPRRCTCRWMFTHSGITAAGPRLWCWRSTCWSSGCLRATSCAVATDRPGCRNLLLRPAAK